MSQQINLFNPVFMRQRHSFGARGMGLALGVMLLGTIALVVFAQLQLAPLRENAVQRDAALKARQARLEAVKLEFAPRASDPVLKSDLQAKEVRLKSLQQAMSMLRQGEGEGGQGFAQYFRALARQSVQGLWLTEVGIEGEPHEISLQGRVLQAALLPAYLSRLAEEPVLRGKTFQTLDMGPPAAQAPVADAAPGAPLSLLPPGAAGSTPAPALSALPPPVSAGDTSRFLEFRLRSSVAPLPANAGGQP